MTAKRRKRDSLIDEIEDALMPGCFIDYNASWDFVHGLEAVAEKLPKLVAKGEAARACEFYEMLLAGCYEKVEEIDDSSGDLGMFFEELFCDWVRARQKAGCDAAETVELTLNWMRSDDYGFFYDIESNLGKAFDARGYKLLCRNFQTRFEKAFAAVSEPRPERLSEFPWEVRKPAGSLKKLYAAKNRIDDFITLSECVGVTPKDCEQIAELYASRKRDREALVWVERGAALNGEYSWGNESAYGLTHLRQELLQRLGRGDEALTSAWAEFQKYPCDHSYDTLMQYVPDSERAAWHRKAVEQAREGSLTGFVQICTATKEWELLAERVLAESHEALVGESHYTTEPAAEGLAEGHPDAAAKLHHALGLRIVDAKKSKYYDAALGHFRQARRLYIEAGMHDEWQILVQSVRERHFRKYSFMPGFEAIVSGGDEDRSDSFAARARHRWREQTD
ncbi:MAG: hypothetical protein KAI66_09160 [Lentisphaeria bacterium]|nr:hypothetical protein [Lentisphaeria bacterium]